MEQLEVISLLLENGAAVDQKDHFGHTPLMVAAIDGHVEAAELLLAKGAAINAKNKGGFTPLMFAAMEGHPAVAKLLLERGANPNLVANGKTARRIAEEKGHKDIADLLQKAGAE